MQQPGQMMEIILFGRAAAGAIKGKVQQMAKEYARDFYKSKEWKRARTAVIKRANGLCERCKAAGEFKPGVIVHHKNYITPANIHDAHVTLDLANLELVCEDCHNKEHKAKQNNRYAFDTNGNIIPPRNV